MIGLRYSAREGQSRTASTPSARQHPLVDDERISPLVQAELARDRPLRRRHHTALWVTQEAIEKHVRNILTRLGLAQAYDDHRRVLAVLRFLEAR